MKYVSPVAELVAIEAIEVLLTSADEGCATQTTCPNYVPGCEEDW